MQARAAGAVSVRLLEQPRTLVASGEAVWIWPGIALTTRRGVEIVPVTDATIRFWVSRPHGPEALDRNLTRAVARAAQCLTAGNETGAQWAIDALQLTEFSQDGALLACAIADDFAFRSRTYVRAQLRAHGMRGTSRYICRSSSSMPKRRGLWQRASSLSIRKNIRAGQPVRRIARAVSLRPSAASRMLLSFPRLSAGRSGQRDYHRLV